MTTVIGDRLRRPQPLTSRTLVRFALRLERERDRVDRTIAMLVAEREALVSGVDLGDVADGGTALSVIEAHLDAVRRERDQVLEALERFGQGAYGVCRHCGVDIPVRRLEVLPATRTCVDCG